MGKSLAKKPKQRVRAGQKHSTLVKVQRVFDLMAELKLEFGFYGDEVFVVDLERKNENAWEIRDSINDELLTELPLRAKEFKICQERDMPPLDAPKIEIDPA